MEEFANQINAEIRLFELAHGRVEWGKVSVSFL
jgi:hypothetical protein